MKQINMKRCAYSILLTTSLAPLAYSGEAIVSTDGSIEIESLGVSLAPTVHAFNWSSLSKGGVDPSSRDSFVIRIKDQNQVKGTLNVRALQDGAVRADYLFTSYADLSVDSLCVAADIPLHAVIGGTWESDGTSGGYPAEKPESPILFSGKTTHFAIQGLDPKQYSLEFTFEKPTQVLLQDNRQWGGNNLSLRLSPPYLNPLTNGMTFALSFSIKATENLVVFQDKPMTITAENGQWIPVKHELEIIPGSALDFSEVIGWHKPAGKLGHVKAVGNHFEFDTLPGVPQRFYGVNLCFTANYITPQEAAKLAARFRRIGYNAVRLHHYDNTLVEGSADKTALNPARLNQLDQLMAQFIANGIYVTTDLFVSRSIPWRSIGIDKAGFVPMNDFKLLCAVNKQAMENWKEFTRGFLSHVNPYTGRSYAEEPALAWIALVNEGNLGNFLGDQRELPDYTEKWNEWLTAKKNSNPAYANIPNSLPGSIYDGSPHACAYSQFLSEAEAAMTREMKAFLQNELQCKALITNSNGWTHKVSDQITHKDVYDYVDDHFYIDHPNFIEKSWTLPSQCPNANPFKNSDMGMLGCSFNRMADMPFTVSEFNFSAPGRYRGVGGIATGAIAALQEWSILWRFAYSHNSESMFNPSKMGYFNVCEDPVMMAAERAAICLFLRGDAAPLTKTFTLVVPRNEATSLQENGMPGVAPAWRDVAWKSKVQVAIDKAPESSTWSLTFPAAYSADASSQARNLVASEAFGGGAVRVDSTQGTLVLDTQRTAGGFAERGTISTQVMTAEILDVPAAVWVSSLDGNPCTTSRRLLLTHVTDVQNTDIQYAERSRRTLLNWGRMPHLAERGRAAITLNLDHPEEVTVYRLSSSGERLGKIETHIVDNALAFTADTGLVKHDATLLYELVREQ